MSGRRSRSRSPRRRRSSPGDRRQRSDGDSSRYERRRSERDRDRDPERTRTGSSSDQRGRGYHHDRDREERRKNSECDRSQSDSTVKNPRPSANNEIKPDEQKKPSGDEMTSRDQENRQTREEGKREEGGNRGRGPLEFPKEKNVLFPSGSNTVNRGRDRQRDRSWREERGSRGQFRGQRSEGILARESMEERGERRLFEALVDPQEVPRSGDYFEHDDRDSAQVTSTRVFDDRRRERFHSPERWSRGRERYRPSYQSRDARDRLGWDVRDRLGRDVRDRLGRDVWDRQNRDVRDRQNRDVRDRQNRDVRDRQNRDVRDRLGDRGRWEQSSRDRERRERGGMHSDWSDRRPLSAGRDRSPVHWKHDLFETVNQQPEEVQPVEPEPKTTKLRTKTFEEGIEDFNIDDLLLMENPIEKMELDV